VLGCILERLEAAEVDRRFDLGSVAANAIDLDARRQGGTAASGGYSLAQAAAREQRRINSVSQRAQLIERCSGVLLNLMRELLGLLGILRRHLLDEARLYREGDEVLLKDQIGRAHV